MSVMPVAQADQVPEFSQEELALVFQNSEGTRNEKPDFLKYLDEQEMETGLTLHPTDRALYGYKR